MVTPKYVYSIKSKKLGNIYARLSNPRSEYFERVTNFIKFLVVSNRARRIDPTAYIFQIISYQCLAYIYIYDTSKQLSICFSTNEA